MSTDISEVRQMVAFGLSIVSLEKKLEWMTQNGQSLLLNWGEDNNLWECCWIGANGKRYTAFEKDVSTGLTSCIKQLFEAL